MDRTHCGTTNITHGDSSLTIQMRHSRGYYRGLTEGVVNLMPTNRSLTELFLIELALECNIVASENILLTLLSTEKVCKALL